MATVKVYGYGVVENYQADDLHERVIYAPTESEAMEAAVQFAEEEGGLFFPDYLLFEHGEFPSRPRETEAIRVWGYRHHDGMEGSDIQERYFGKFEESKAEECIKEFEAERLLCIDREYCTVSLT